MAEDRRRWIARRSWVVAADGTKRGGTLWSVHGESVQIRVDGVQGVTVLPIASRGTRWGFIGEEPG